LDVGIFGPTERYWGEKCDELADIGLKVTKENVIAVYLEVREKSMTKANIISTFRKTGIWLLDPTVFKEEEYAPSWATSTQPHLPNNYARPTSPDGPSDVPIPPLHVATAVPTKKKRQGRSVSGQLGPYALRTALLATLTMLEEQLATARAEAEAATAHAILMARENLKINNLLNAKTGKKKEGGCAHFLGAARHLTSGEGLEQKRKEVREKEQQKEEAEAKQLQRKADQARRRQEKEKHAKEVQER
jgi:hypothetical protein